MSDPEKPMEEQATDLVGPKDLLRALLALARAEKTGALAVHDGEGTTWLRMEEGCITAATWGGEEEGFLASLIESGGWVQPRVLRRARRRARSRGTTLAAALAREGGLRPRELREHVARAVEEEIGRLAGTEGVWWEFTPQAKDEPFDPEILALGLRLQVDLLLVAIAGREEQWEILNEIFPDRLAVLVTREACGRYFDAPPGRFEEERQVLVLVDGERDVEEIVQASPLGAFRTLQLLHRFLKLEEVRELNPAELIQVAAACKKQGRFDKCLRLYLRAEALGQGAFDLDLTIGSLYEAMGQEEEAFRRYRRYGERAAAAGDREAAREGYRRALALRPSSLELREALVELLDAETEKEERLHEARALFRLARSLQDHTRMERALRQLLAAGAASSEELREYLRYLLHARGAEAAWPELLRLSEELLREGRAAEAAVVLETAVRQRPDDTEAHTRLAEALAAAGESARALQVYEALLGRLRARGGAEEGMEALCERLLALDPDHPQGLRYRARRALASGRRDEAAAVLQRLAARYAKAGETAKHRAVLARLVRLCPEDISLRVAYAEALLAAGREAAGTRALRQAAALAAADPAHRREALRLYEQALTLEPFDLAARRELALLLEEEGDPDGARPHWEALGELLLVAGRPREAARVYAHLQELRPEECDYVRRAARAWARLRDTQERREALVRLLKRLVRLEDYGFARWLVHKCGSPPELKALLADLPDRRQVRNLKARLERLEARLAARRRRWQRLADHLRKSRSAPPPTEVSVAPPREAEPSLVRKMVTTKEVPGSILEIARKLKGLQ